MGSRRSSSSTWLILPFLIEFLKSYPQIIWKKNPQTHHHRNRLQNTEKNIFLNVNRSESRSTLSSCKSCIFFPTSVWPAASSFSAWDRSGHQPVAKHAVSYEGPARVFTYSGVSLPKRLSYVCSGNRKRSKATIWRRRLTNWWRRSVHFLSALIRY